MVVENFSRKVIGSGVFDTYIATGFFATLIFFIFNSHLYTPLEMVFGTIVVTVALKAITNMMFALVVLLFDLRNTQNEQDFKMAEDKLNLLVHEMQMTEAKIKAGKVANK